MLTTHTELETRVEELTRRRDHLARQQERANQVLEQVTKNLAFGDGIAKQVADVQVQRDALATAVAEVDAELTRTRLEITRRQEQERYDATIAQMATRAGEAEEARTEFAKAYEGAVATALDAVQRMVAASFRWRTAREEYLRLRRQVLPPVPAGYYGYPAESAEAKQADKVYEDLMALTDSAWAAEHNLDVPDFGPIGEAIQNEYRRTSNLENRNRARRI